jgi:hypothetical protein
MHAAWLVQTEETCVGEKDRTGECEVVAKESETTCASIVYSSYTVSLELSSVSCLIPYCTAACTGRGAGHLMICSEVLPPLATPLHVMWVVGDTRISA